ncbi:radical SAM protein [Sorangium sp. So ce1151]|uniref:radical SAM protein n=1 Tax=Sorangium sp. So ce1151 TaxID=3133332 RepID=UPI003F644741
MKPVTAEQLRAAEEALSRLAETSPYESFFRELLQHDRIPAELPREIAVSEGLVCLGSADTLARRLGERLCRRPRPDLPSPAEELWSAAEALGAPERAALDVLIRRAIDPFEALATWPLDVLFTPEEASALGEARGPRRRVPLPVIAWRPGEDMEYRGYACAIIKFTRLCNLRCTYCNDWRDGPDQTMSFSVQTALFKRFISEGTHDAIDFVWHGGEPTLFGRRRFLRVLAMQRFLQRPGQRIVNVIQTNATTLTPAWARFLRVYRFRVGVSIDGPEAVHDAARVDARGRGSFDRVRRGMRTMREAGLGFSALLVTGRAVLAMGGAAVLAFLKEEGIDAVALLPVHPAAGPVQPGQDYLEYDEFTRFLLELHEARKSAPEPWVQIRELDAPLKAIRAEQPGFCELLGNCIGAYYSIEPNGAVGHCDKYIGDPDYTLGNIVSDSIDAIRASDRSRRLIEQDRARLEKKQACRHFSRCRGWCPHRNYMAERYASRRDDGCCGLSQLFDALEKEGDHG